MGFYEVGGWPTWTIYQLRNEKQIYYASFGTRKLCEEYLKFKKEQCFFETGSMNTAEEEWGENKFIIDYSFTMDRKSVFKNYQADIDSWGND